MKKIANSLWLILPVLWLGACGTDSKDDRSKADEMDSITYEEIQVEAPFKMPVIHIPVFPHRLYNITEFGAKEGDKAKTTRAIFRAIAACHKAGGGRVLVPAGNWITGKIHFKDNINLHIAEGAQLVFSDNPQDYLPAVQTSWEGMECFNYSPLIYAFDCKNIALTGKGTIRAKMDKWEEWFARPPAHMNALKELYNKMSKGVPVEERQMAVGENNMRPQLIHFNRCENILIEDVKIRNSPFWTIHLLLCNQAVVRGIDVFAHGHNNDGIDPEMTQNLLIEECIFDQGDDAIAVKSGRNHDAWRLHTPSENIVIRNCTIKEGHQMLAIGSEISGGVNNIYMDNCTFPAKEETNLLNVVFIKTNKRRGGFVKNIYAENIKAGIVKGGILGIRTNVLYQWKDLVPTYEERLTPISDVHLNNIDVQQCEIAINIKGETEKPVKNIYLSNIAVDKITEQEFLLENVENIVRDGEPYGN